MKSILYLIVLCFSLTACHTFNLNKGPDVHPRYETENFHHIGILKLVEFSEPVDPRKSCDGDWNSVETRTGPIQVLIGLIVGGFYNPEEVKVSCKM